MAEKIPPEPESDYYKKSREDFSKLIEPLITNADVPEEARKKAYLLKESFSQQKYVGRERALLSILGQANDLSLQMREEGHIVESAPQKSQPSSTPLPTKPKSRNEVLAEAHYTGTATFDERAPFEARLNLKENEAVPEKKSELVEAAGREMQTGSAHILQEFDTNTAASIADHFDESPSERKQRLQAAVAEHNKRVADEEELRTIERMNTRGSTKSVSAARAQSNEAAEKAKNQARAAALAPRDYSSSPTMSSEAERVKAEKEKNATIPPRDYSNSPTVSSEAERDAVDTERNAHLSKSKPEYVGPNQEELDGDASMRNRERLATYKEKKAMLPQPLPADFVPAKPLAVENEKEIALTEKDSVTVQKSSEVKKAAVEEKKQVRKEKVGKALENTTSFFSKSKDFLSAQAIALGQKLVAFPGNAVEDLKKLGKGTKNVVTHPFESWGKMKSANERVKAYGAYLKNQDIALDVRFKKVAGDVYGLGEAYRKLPFRYKMYLAGAFLGASALTGGVGVFVGTIHGLRLAQRGLTGLGTYTLVDAYKEKQLAAKEAESGEKRSRFATWKKRGLALGAASLAALGVGGIKEVFETGNEGAEWLINAMSHGSAEHIGAAVATSPQPDILSGIPKPPFMPKIDLLATGPDTAFIGPQGGNIYDTSIHLDGSPHTPLPPLTKYPDFSPAPAEHVAAAPIETPAPAPAEAVAPAAPEAAAPVPAEAAAPVAPPAPVEAAPAAPMEHAHAPRSLLEPKPRITDLAANTREQLETKFLNDWQAHMADHPNMPSPPADQMNAYIAQNMPGAQPPIAEAVAPQAPAPHPLNEVRVKLGLEPLQPPGVESHVGAQDLKIHPDTAPAPVEAAVQSEVATPLEPTHAPADITPAHTEAPAATPIETAAATAPVGVEPPIPGHPEIQPNQFGLRIDEHVAARFTDPKGNNIIFGGEALKDRITAAQTWVEQDHAAVVYFDFTTPRLGGLLPDVHRLGRAFWDPTTNQVQVENELMNPEMRLPGNVPPNLPAVSDLAHRVPAA